MAAELLTDASRALDANANPMSGARWFFYASGTTTPQSVYTTAALNVAHANPVVADAGGKFAPIYFNASLSYRGVLKSANEATTIYDIDPINSGVLSALAGDDGATLVNFTPSGSGATTIRVDQALDQFVFAAWFSGYDESGTTDSSSAIMAADAVARSRNKTLMLTGTPLVEQTLLVDAPTNWRMQGSHFKPGFPNAGPRIIKPATMNATVIRVTPNAYHSIFEGVNIAGVAGNGGDGWNIEADGCYLANCAVLRMGQDGFRLGSKVANPYQVGVNYNADHTRLSSCTASMCGRYGLNIDDESGITNSNAHQIDMMRLFGNTVAGLYANKAYLGTVITGLSCEANGIGVHLDEHALHHVFVGGDIEANTTNLVEYNTFANRFHDTLINGVQYNTLLRQGSFTPVIVGSTAAGVGTYAAGGQRGYYAMNGRVMSFWIELEWTAHTGTGDLLISGLPFTPTTSNANIPNFVACTITANNLALAAGAQVSAAFNHNANRVYIYTNSAGVRTQLPMEAAGTISVSGWMAPLMPSE